MFTCVSNLLAFNSSVHSASTVPEAQLSLALPWELRATSLHKDTAVTHGLSRLPDAAYQNLHLSCSSGQALLRPVSSC